MNRYLKSSVKVLALGAMFGTLPAFAEGEVVDNNCANSLKGFTVGADLVYSHAAAKHEQLDATLTSANTTGHDDEFDSIDHKRCCLDPSINIGYTHVCGSWYVGAAGEISYGKTSEINSDFGGVTTVDTKIGRTSYGLKLKGGYFVQDLKSAIYGIVGIKWRDVKLGFNVGDVKGSDAKLKRPLFVVGVGVEHPIYKKLSVSAEYEYAWRNSNDTSTVSANGSTASLHAKQRLNEHSIKLGIKYHI